MNNYFLEVKDLKVIYKTDLETVEAVNGVSFTLQKGETLGIVGETGAGKTTTSLAILRLVPERTARIISGSVNFSGVDLLKVKEREMQRIRGEKISMIFQDPMTSLNPIITVGRQINEALELHNTTGRTKAQIEARTDEILRLVGIPETRKKDYPHQFSGGMKQRVVIAIALACEPELLIADEPTTALDVTIQAQVLAMINELKERLGTSMIMITHDLGIIAQTCERVAVMYAGQIIEQGTAKDIFTAKNHHPYTMGLLGSIPDLKKKTHRLNVIEGLMPDPTALPRGCNFSPRCKHCMDVCKEQEPQACSDGTHTICCHLFRGGVQ